MATGTRTTYSDTNLNRVIVAEGLSMIDWTEAPLLNLLGTDNGSRFEFDQIGSTIYWNEDKMSPRETLAAEAVDDSEVEIDVTAGTGTYFKAGDIVRIGNELVWLSSVAANAITGTRGFAGTTAAAHDNGSTIYLVSHAALEGSNAVTGHTTTVDRFTNYTQILRDAVQVSGSEQANPKYGVTDTLARQIEKLIGGGPVGTKGKAGKLAILLEQTFAHGLGAAAGSATTARAMKGARGFLSTHVTDLGGVALTRKHLEDTLQAIYESGGAPETIICGGHARRKISSFYEKYITTERSEERGGHKITTVATDFNDALEVMYWRWCPAGELYIIEKDLMGWVPMPKREFAVYDRASLGDYTLKDVLGEYSFVLMNEAAHGLIRNFSLTA